MSLSDCEKCWNTPCTCGYEYRNWSIPELQKQIKMLQTVLEGRRKEAFEIVEKIEKEIGEK